MSAAQMQIREIFLAALEKPPIERAAYLEEACAGDAPLKRRVEALLQAHDEPGDFLSEPANGGDATASHRSAAGTTGDVIAGKYKLLQQIGEGGMGTVWMADQTEPVKRRVAVKLIRVERGQSKTVLSRFDAERQAIALMDHPNIAKLLDAGTTESGSPYFVMELVKGKPLTEFCDTHRLSVPERLRLFTQVCSAVQHAHQKGVIHRDLKPSNVLVESHDGKPVPKVIDFGLAKAMSGQPLTENTLFTAFGSVMGTPTYMAPEQATFSAVDIDTRADIYALGVILYELLTGTTPITREALKKAQLDELLRLVREEEPPTPSSRLSTTESSPSTAANRQMEPLKLGRFVKGELDWIVMKALAKERDRRYETANGFAKDVERFLNQEPVNAGPPSAGYKLRKFVQRNKTPVAAATLVLLALVLGVAGTTWGLIAARRAAAAERAAKLDAEHQRENALQAAGREAEQRERAEKSRAEALAKEAEANAVVKFFADRVLAAGRPKGEAGGLGHDVSLQDAVKASLPALATSFKNQPLVEARLHQTLGTTFALLGDYLAAARELAQARDLFARHLGPEHSDSLDAMINLAACYESLSRHAESLRLREEIAGIRKRSLPPDDPRALLSNLSLASSYAAMGRHAEALKLREEVVAARKRTFPRNDPETLWSMANLSSSYEALNRQDEALRLREETLTLRRQVLPPDHPDTLLSMTQLANSYRKAKRFAEALALLQETLAAQKRILPADHPDILGNTVNLAVYYYDADRIPEAVKLLEEALPVLRSKFPDHPHTTRCLGTLATIYRKLGRPADALTLQTQALAIAQRVLGPHHQTTLKESVWFAECLADLKRRSEAVQLLEDTLAIQRRVLSVDHPDALLAMSRLAPVYAAVGRRADAVKLSEESLAAHRRVFSADHPETLKAMRSLASIYGSLGRYADAVRLGEEALPAHRRALGDGHVDTLKAVEFLANSYAALGRNTDALSVVDEFLTKESSLPIEPVLNSFALALRVQRCRERGDLADCRAIAEMIEKLNLSGPISFYNAACGRAITAGLQSKANTPEAARLAEVDADKAMAWLQKAVAAGWTDGSSIRKDDDLAFLRNRDDFKKLLARLEAKAPSKNGASDSPMKK